MYDRGAMRQIFGDSDAFARHSDMLNISKTWPAKPDNWPTKCKRSENKIQKNEAFRSRSL